MEILLNNLEKINMTYRCHVKYVIIESYNKMMIEQCRKWALAKRTADS